MSSEKIKGINLLCVVCDYNKRDKAKELLNKYQVLMHLVSSGKGTASTRILSYLGLGETEKSVFFSMIPSTAAHEAIEHLHKQMQLDRPGNGVAFLTRIYQGCYHKVVGFDAAANGGDTMQQNASEQYSMIMVVLNRGYSDDVMEIARDSGVTGGTIIHARSFGAGGMEKFFGMEISAEKEMLMIIAQRDVACDVMGKVAEKMGPETDAGAISFSMPVDDVRGLQMNRIK